MTAPADAHAQDLDADAQDLTRGAVDVLPAGALAARLADPERGPLRVKLGLDPTSPDLHLGHTVVLTVLRRFQDAGHTAVLIVGDYTARVGDPSGRSKARPQVTDAEIEANLATYAEQAFRVLDEGRTEIRRNGEWFAPMPSERLFALARTATVAQLLERDDFAGRFAAHAPITLLEMLYPLLQGYDSVAVDADLELGGTDQTFNLLMGRAVQAAYGRPAQSVLTVPLLTGTDGAEKMSKSLGNAIGVADPPADQFGRTMSIPDALMGEWATLLDLGPPPGPDEAPNLAKRRLARTIVGRFHGAAAASAAEEDFDRRFVHHDAPAELDVHTFACTGTAHLPDLLATAFALASRGEARRLIDGGGVRIDGTVVAPGAYDHPCAGLDGTVLSVGRRRFVRLAVR